MANASDKVKEVFLQAAEIASPEDRIAFLDAACGEDVGLRRRVEALILAHERPESLLDKGVVAAPTIDQPITEGPGTVIGPYKLLQKIGEGGFGVVYMADQKEPVKRRVALKIIKPGMDTRQVIARFEAERQALAMMDHPNIARVLDAGTTESGRPYFVMELVKGVPITRYCDDKHLTPRERLELFVPVCQALQHAHQKGVIHRDIKPTNVLVAKYDDRPVPKVIDFGVAKATEQQLTEKTMFTQFGQIVGTVDYMSPEQAELNQLDIDTRSDIYSLGVLLYELLTGETPFDRQRLRSAAFDELLRIIREEEPPKPSLRLTTSKSLESIAANRQIEPKKLSTLFRGELDWIVMKALEKDRTRRYETANGLANDIRRYLNDVAVVACPPSAGYRFRKFARRNKAALTTALLVAAALVVGLFGTGWQAVRATRAKHDAQSEQARAVLAWKQADEQREQAVEAEEAERQESEKNRRLFYTSDVALAQQAWRDGDPIQMVDRLERHRPEAGQEDLRGFEWYYMWRLAQRSQTAPSFDHDARSEVTSLAFSPTDDALVAAISEDAVLRLWDVAAGRPKWEELEAHRPERDMYRAKGFCVVFSPDGRLLATAGARSENPYNCEVKLWDAETGKQLHCIEKQLFLTLSLAFSPDGKLLAMVTRDRVRLWDVGKFLECLGEGKPIPPLFVETEFRKPGEVLLSIAFAPGGNLLAFGDWSNEVTLCDLQTGQMTPLGRQEGNDQAVLCLAFSPDGKTLASGDLGGTVRLWDIPDDATATTQRTALHASTKPIFDLAFSPDGQLLASSSDWITLWDAATAERLGSIRGHSGFVPSLAFSSNGATLASGGGDGMVRLWSVAPDEEATVLECGSGVAGVTFSPDGTTVASSSYFGKVTLWDTLSGTEYGHFDVSAGQGGPAFSPDGRLLACGSESSVRLLDVLTGWEVRRFVQPEPGLWIWSMAFSPDGRTIAVCNESGLLNLWTIRTGESETLGKLDRRAKVAFSPDGSVLAAAMHNRPVVLWNLSTRKPSTIETSRPFGKIAFSPDGSHLAWAGTERTVELWDKVTGEVHVLKGHRSYVTCLAFSRDGATLFSGAAEGEIKIWDVTTCRERATLRGHQIMVRALAVSPDGTTLASGSGDGARCSLHLWRAAADDDRQELARRDRLENRVRAISKADPREQEQTIAEVETRLINSASSALAPYDIALAISVGRSLAAGGHHELAGEAYDRFAKVLTRVQDPKTQELARGWETVLWQHRARLQMEQSQWEDAIASFTEMIDLNPDDWRFPAQRGSAHAELGAWEEALVDFSKAIELGPDVWTLREHRAKAHVMLGHWKEAADDFAVVPKHAAYHPDNLLGMAAVQLLAGDTQAYKTTCEQAFPRFSRSYTSHKARLALMCCLASDCGIDRQELTRLADNALTEGDDRLIRLAKGMDDYRCGRYEQALAHLPQQWGWGDALNQPLTLLFQAMSHHRLGQAEQAHRLLERAVTAIEDKVPSIDGPPLDDGPADRWIVWCTIELVRREAQETISGPVYESIDKADALVEAGELSDALRELSQAIALAPNDSSLLFRRGELYSRLEQPDKATEDYAKVIELTPETWTGSSDRAKACAILGRWKEAADEFAEVVQHTPDDQYTWQGLAALQLLAGDLEGYKRTCGEMFPRFAEKISDHAQWRSVTMCSLAPDCGIDREKLTTVAGLAFAANDRLGLAVGMNDYRCGRYEQALAHLPSVGDALNLPLTLLFQAMSHHRLGQAEEAGKLLKRASTAIESKVPSIDGPPLAEYLPDRWIVWCMIEVVRREAEETILGPAHEYVERANELVEAGKVPEAIEQLNQAISRAPDDPLPLRTRGGIYVRLSQWREAAADYAKLVELDPADSRAWLHTAPLLILAGDQSGYTQHCQSMVRRFGNTDDAPEADQTVKASLLGSGTVDDTKLPLETLESALDDASAQAWFYKYGYTTRALAAYRAGDAAKAIESVHKAQESEGYADRPSVQALALSLLAMAQHELGNTQDARQALAQASDLTDQYLPKLASGELGNTWPDWLIAQILQAEAAEKIAAPRSPTPEAKAETGPKTE